MSLFTTKSTSHRFRHSEAERERKTGRPTERKIEKYIFFVPYAERNNRMRFTRGRCPRAPPFSPPPHFHGFAHASMARFSHSEARISAFYAINDEQRINYQVSKIDPKITINIWNCRPSEVASIFSGRSKFNKRIFERFLICNQSFIIRAYMHCVVCDFSLLSIQGSHPHSSSDF